MGLLEKSRIEDILIYTKSFKHAGPQDMRSLASVPWSHMNAFCVGPKLPPFEANLGFGHCLFFITHLILSYSFLFLFFSVFSLSSSSLFHQPVITQ